MSTKAKRILALLNDPRHKNRLLDTLNKRPLMRSSAAWEGRDDHSEGHGEPGREHDQICRT